MIAHQKDRIEETEEQVILGFVLNRDQFNTLSIYRHALRNDAARESNGEWAYHGYREPTDFVKPPNIEDCRYLAKCGLLNRGSYGRYRITTLGREVVAWGWREVDRSEEIRKALAQHYPHTLFKVSVTGASYNPVYLIEWRSELKENPTEAAVIDVIPTKLLNQCYFNIPF